MIAPKTGPGRPQLVLVNIGNSNISLATFSGDTRNEARRLPNDPFDPVVAAVAEAWDRLPDAANRAVVVSSVCPAVLERMISGCQARRIEPVLVVGREIDIPIGADVPEPHKVGTDRLCVAAAAFERVQSTCVVADLGTAVTIDLVSDNGVFLGGTILPGLALSARALHEHTAVLPLVEIGAPKEALGKDTCSAIRNGVFSMMAGALREITERYATEIGKWPPLIVTGGDAEGIAGACDFVDGVMPDLCLDGLVIAYRRHVARHAPADE